MLCFGAARLEKGISFGGEDMHETGAETGGVARAKGHDTKGVLFVVGREESKLVLVTAAHGNLVIAAAGIETAVLIRRTVFRPSCQNHRSHLHIGG